MSALTNKTVDLYYIFFIINLKISTLYFIILSVIGLAMFLLAKIAIFSLPRLFFFHITGRNWLPYAVHILPQFSLFRPAWAETWVSFCLGMNCSVFVAGHHMAALKGSGACSSPQQK